MNISNVMMNTNNTSEVCPICGGLGVVTYDVPIEHPDFGKAFPCVCQKDNVKNRKTEQQRKVGNLDAYSKQTFATFRVDYSLLVENNRYLQDACANIEGASSLTELQRRKIIWATEYAYRFSEDPTGWLLL